MSLTKTRPQFRKEISQLWENVANKTACFSTIHNLYTKLYGYDEWDGKNKGWDNFFNSKKGIECSEAFSQFIKIYSNHEPSD